MNNNITSIEPCLSSSTLSNTNNVPLSKKLKGRDVLLIGKQTDCSLGTKLLMGGIAMGLFVFLGFLKRNEVPQTSSVFSNLAIQKQQNSIRNLNASTLPVCDLNQYRLLNRPVSNLITTDSIYIATKKKIENIYRLAPSADEVARSIFRTFVWHVTIRGVVKVMDDRMLPYAPLAPLLWGSIQEIYPHIKQYELRTLIAEQKQNKQNVVLICQAVSDWNGAFFRITPKYMENIKQLTTSHSIVIKRVNTVEEINESIDKITKVGKRITHLFLNGHGEPEEIELGTDTLVTHEMHEAKGSWFWGNKVSVSRIHFSKLEPDANILLNSCSTGRPLPYPQLNIAEWVQYHAGATRKVHAPEYPSTGVEMDLDNGFNVVFGESEAANISYDTAYEKVQHHIVE